MTACRGRVPCWPGGACGEAPLDATGLCAPCRERLAAVAREVVDAEHAVRDAARAARRASGALVSALEHAARRRDALAELTEPAPAAGA